MEENLMHHELVNSLEAQELETRMEAIDTLGQCGDKEDIDPLIDHMERETDQSARERIALALEVLLPANGFCSIDRMLRSYDAFVRNAAVDILKKQDTAIILDKLAELSRDKDKDVRKLALDALSAYRDRRVVDIIKERLSDPDINVVYTAVEYLGNMKAHDAADAIGKLLITTDNPMLRCTALEALANIGSSQHTDKIVNFFCNDDDPLLRYSFIKFLGQCASPDQFIEYIDTLSHSEHFAQYAREIMDAADTMNTRFPEALDNGRFKQCLDKLSERIPDGTIKYELSAILSRLSGSDMLDKARKEIMQDDVMSVIAAVEIIGSYGTEDDIKLLDEVAKRFTDEEVMEVVDDARKRIEERINR
jgi:HEAT repeat protein